MRLRLNDLAACARTFADQDGDRAVMVFEAYRAGLLVEPSGMLASHWSRYRPLRFEGCFMTLWDRDFGRPWSGVVKQAEVDLAELLNLAWSVVCSYAVNGTIVSPQGQVADEDRMVAFVVGRGRRPVRHEPFIWHHPNLHEVHAAILLGEAINSFSDDLARMESRLIH